MCSSARCIFHTETIEIHYHHYSQHEAYTRLQRTVLAGDPLCGHVRKYNHSHLPKITRSLIAIGVTVMVARLQLCSCALLQLCISKQDAEEELPRKLVLELSKALGTRQTDTEVCAVSFCR